MALLLRAGGKGGDMRGEGRGMGTTSFWTLPPPLNAAINKSTSTVLSVHLKYRIVGTL